MSVMDCSDYFVSGIKAVSSAIHCLAKGLVGLPGAPPLPVGQVKYPGKVSPG